VTRRAAFQLSPSYASSCCHTSLVAIAYKARLSRAALPSLPKPRRAMWKATAAAASFGGGALAFGRPTDAWPWPV